MEKIIGDTPLNKRELFKSNSIEEAKKIWSTPVENRRSFVFEIFNTSFSDSGKANLFGNFDHSQNIVVNTQNGNIREVMAMTELGHMDRFKFIGIKLFVFNKNQLLLNWMIRRFNEIEESTTQCPIFPLSLIENPRKNRELIIPITDMEFSKNEWLEILVLPTEKIIVSMIFTKK